MPKGTKKKSATDALQSPGDYIKFFSKDSPKRMTTIIDLADKIKETASEEGLQSAKTAQHLQENGFPGGGAAPVAKKKTKKRKAKAETAAVEVPKAPGAKKKKKGAPTLNALIAKFSGGKRKKRGGRKSSASALTAGGADAGNIGAPVGVPGTSEAGGGKAKRGRLSKKNANIGSMAEALLSGESLGMGGFNEFPDHLTGNA